MCTICGCKAPHAHAAAHRHEHQGHSVPNRLIQLAHDVLSANNHVAAHVREHLLAQHTLALNLVSSPGAGKTTLLVETIRQLRTRQTDRPVAVIEGDQQTSLDAQRILATGVPAVQINTGKGCHLDARMVHDALHDLPPLPHGVLLIENVGNLVCPAGFDLGEQAKVLVFSVTEGEDKPLKYPDMFQAARVVVLSKCDLLPHLSFDVDKALSHLRQVNPDAIVFQVSATTGQGLAAWLQWVEEACTAA
jgi:hydrogenase nickel incorporation protein HypB